MLMRMRAVGKLKDSLLCPDVKPPLRRRSVCFEVSVSSEVQCYSANDATIVHSRPYPRKHGSPVLKNTLLIPGATTTLTPLPSLFFLGRWSGYAWSSDGGGENRGC